LALPAEELTKRRRLELLYWVIRADRAGNRRPEADYAELAKRLGRHGLRFPAQFLIGKLPNPRGRYDVRDGRLLDEGLLAIALLGEQRDADAVEPLLGLLQQPELKVKSQFVCKHRGLIGQAARRSRTFLPIA
jgi:hypothetical protein